MSQRLAVLRILSDYERHHYTELMQTAHHYRTWLSAIRKAGIPVVNISGSYFIAAENAGAVNRLLVEWANAKRGRPCSRK